MEFQLFFLNFYGIVKILQAQQNLQNLIISAYLWNFTFYHIFLHYLSLNEAGVAQQCLIALDEQYCLLIFSNCQKSIQIDGTIIIFWYLLVLQSGWTQENPIVALNKTFYWKITEILIVQTIQ